MKKILWSVDALDTSKELAEKTVKFLQTLESGLDAEIHPVFVLSPEQMNFGLEYELPDMQQYLPAAKKALEQRLAHASLKHLKPGKVLVNNRPSQRESVELLAQYALNNEFDYILVGSHGRKGLDRLMLGSFAEELLLQSKVPVIVTGKAAKVIPSKIGRIVFPTDFEEGAVSIFREIVDFASRVKAKVTVLHAAPRVIEPAFQGGVYLLSGGWVPSGDFSDAQRKRHEKEMEKWTQIGKEAGVTVESIHDHEANSVLEAILKQTEGAANANNDTLVAMAAHSGRVAAALIGSVTRQVVRAAHCPVWIVRRI